MLWQMPCPELDLRDFDNFCVFSLHLKGSLFQVYSSTVLKLVKMCELNMS